MVINYILAKKVVLESSPEKTENAINFVSCDHHP